MEGHEFNINICLGGSFLAQIIYKSTLPETNSEFTPENWWLEDGIYFLDGQFSGAFAVSFREGSLPEPIFFSKVQMLWMYWPLVLDRMVTWVQWKRGKKHMVGSPKGNTPLKTKMTSCNIFIIDRGIHLHSWLFFYCHSLVSWRVYIYIYLPSSICSPAILLGWMFEKVLEVPFVVHFTIKFASYCLLFHGDFTPSKLPSTEHEKNGFTWEYGMLSQYLQYFFSCHKVGVSMSMWKSVKTSPSEKQIYKRRCFNNI